MINPYLFCCNMYLYNNTYLYSYTFEIHPEALPANDHNMFFIFRVPQANLGYNSPWANLITVNRKPLDYGLSDGSKTPTRILCPKGCGNWSPAFCHFGCIDLLGPRWLAQSHSILCSSQLDMLNDKERAFMKLFFWIFWGYVVQFSWDDLDR